VKAALQIAHALHENQINLVIREKCLSSCANYILPAGINTIVEANALIGWHGGAMQEIYKPFYNEELVRQQAIEDLRAQGISEGKFRPILDQLNLNEVVSSYVKDLFELEEQFFSVVSADQAITIVGMLPELAEERSNTDFYFYDVHTMSHLGLDLTFEDASGFKSSEKAQYFNIPKPALLEMLKRHEERKKDFINRLLN
jgi:hypothetical protein